MSDSYGDLARCFSGYSEQSVKASQIGPAARGANGCKKAVVTIYGCIRLMIRLSLASAVDRAAATSNQPWGKRGKTMKAMAPFGKPDGQSQTGDRIAEKSNATGAELTISEMAAEFGVSLRTLRFYEDRKLLRPRREGHNRLYGGADRVRMQMIVKGKQLGFTLTEIADLIGTQESTEDFEGKLQPAQIVTQIDHLERQRAEIDEAISRLRATHDRLAGADTVVPLRAVSGM